MGVNQNLHQASEFLCFVCNIDKSNQIDKKFAWNAKVFRWSRNCIVNQLDKKAIITSTIQTQFKHSFKLDPIGALLHFLAN